ncbi:MAG: M20/M25/M40 family metallo-hydrolase [Pirellulaceae bacterium]|nr:M20/M25/M40 family metallo-hydrolase [Pirellulaceae bacterium]
MINQSTPARANLGAFGSFRISALAILAAGLFVALPPRVVADEPAVQDDVAAVQAETASAAEARIRQTVELLASDAMEGRGLGTKGLDRAADYLSRRFAELGLKTDLCGGGPFHEFTVQTQKDGDRHRVDWSGFLADAGQKQQTAGQPGAGLDTATDARTKPNASQHVEPKSGPRVDPRTDSKTDPRTESMDGFTNDRKSDESWHAEKTREKTATKTIKTTIKNVVAVLEGEGPLAHETIIIGAHYDHLGQRRGENGEEVVYYGANDNASGTAALLEVARILSRRESKLPRRIVFVAFSGEEQGLLGSLHYVNHPPIPLGDTIAMINLDMVGRMEDDYVMVMGTGSSPALAQMTRQTADEHEIGLLSIPSTSPCSDHAPFYSRRIPVVFFCTIGDMRDYHQPTDTADKIYYPGIERVARMTADLAVTVAEAEERPEFTERGLQGALLRGAIRFFGNVARQMAAEGSDRTQPPNRADEDSHPNELPVKPEPARELEPAR